MINTNNIKHFSLANPLLWIIFLVYTILLSVGISHHELWTDELQSWNIARDSKSFLDLISNTRYEGHPPIWYSLLWIISRFTHNIHYMQLAQLIIASVVIFVILFFSPFPLITRILIPFGYYFLFDYGILSRNYAIGVLFAFCICLIIQKDFKYKLPLYYVLLFLLSNTHLLSLFLACGLHLYFLLFCLELKKEINIIILHILIGALVFLPAIYFIFPPFDTIKTVSSQTQLWNIRQLTALLSSPLEAFIPIPAWWNYHFWNTQFLLEAHNKYPILKFVSAFISVVIIGYIFFLFKKDKKILIFFISIFLLTISFFIATSIKSARHVGFIYMGFLIACWLYYYTYRTNKNIKLFINIVLIVQLVGGVFSFAKDIELPFSNANKVSELLKEIPENEKVITDYLTLNIPSAFIDKPFYCIELKREISFYLSGIEWAIVVTSEAYTNGIKYLLKKESITDVYIISIFSKQEIVEKDPEILKTFQLELIDKKEGAIVKKNNLYLYKISFL